MAIETADRHSLNRASVVSSTAGIFKPDGEYKGIETPADIEGGALRSGGAPNLFTKDTFALLMNYAAIGIIYGAFPRTVFPFLAYYLNMDGYQIEAANALVSIAWSFKTFIGMISDSFPIFGYRRRPYMVIGWTVCCAFLVIMACIPVEDPFYHDPADRRNNIIIIKEESFLSGLVPANFSRNSTHMSYLFTNPGAPFSGSKYILLMMFASLGYVVADVAADAVVVEFAQREPIAVRGTTQTMIYATRFLFNAAASAIVGFGMNGEEYGGSFDFSLKFNHVMIILAVPAAIVAPSSWFLLKEEKVTRESFFGRVKEMWKITQQRAIWQVMAYTFLSSVFYGISTSAETPIATRWVKVEPLNENIQNIATRLIAAGTMFTMKKYGLDWDWRRTTAVTAILMVSIDVVVMNLVIWDVVRYQWFYLGVPLVVYLPFAINFIISTYVTVELADPGFEGATYGLLTTVNNLAIPFSSSITKQINAEFDVYNDNIMTDTDHVRKEVLMVYLISWGSKLFSLAFLVLLPRQKAETQELKRTGGKSKLMGGLVLGTAFLALVWGVTTNLMSIFPSTACLKIAGGKGCP